MLDETLINDTLLPEKNEDANNQQIEDVKKNKSKKISLPEGMTNKVKLFKEKISITKKDVSENPEKKLEDHHETVNISDIEFVLDGNSKPENPTNDNQDSQGILIPEKVNDEIKNDSNLERDIATQDVAVEIDYAYPPAETTILAKSLKLKSISELNKIAEKYGIQNSHRMLKQDIIAAILKQANFSGELIYSDGILEILNDGNGFLRSQSENYASCPDDVFISSNQVKKFGLRYGDQISGYVRAPKKGERYFSLLRLTELNGRPANEVYTKINFENLVPLYPKEKLNFQFTGANSISTRVIDLICPIGKGQRALIVAPPRTGKTVLMQSIAHAINQNHPEIYLIYLGIDERPEEFTEMQRTIKGEVVSSTFDEPAYRHVALADIVIEKAKRLVEKGNDVVILLDSITRLARAYNNVAPSSGKILTGGVDSNALQKPKRFFGAARNIEDGGSLTIIATALVETGSKMDEVIFEEFKGTGNAEIVLDRKIADRRVFPAIDVLKSGTRKEDEMIDPDTLTKMWMLRRVISGMGASHEALEFLIKKIKDTKDNADFFVKMNTV